MSQYRRYRGQGTQTYQKLYGFKNLLAWQAADELAWLVHEAMSDTGPRYYRLSSQMLSSASSVKANIAEGYCRNSLGDYIRFCEIARGSLGELGSQLQDCERWGVLDDEQLEQLLVIYRDASFMLEKLIKGLRAKRSQGDWDRSLKAKEQPAEYQAGDADVEFMSPDELP